MSSTSVLATHMLAADLTGQRSCSTQTDVLLVWIQKEQKQAHLNATPRPQHLRPSRPKAVFWPVIAIFFTCFFGMAPCFARVAVGRIPQLATLEQLVRILMFL